MQLKIVEFPDPVLRRATRPVTVFDEALKTFVDEMTIVMKDDDGVGIAAPQVGVSKKVAVVCFEDILRLAEVNVLLIAISKLAM